MSEIKLVTVTLRLSGGPFDGEDFTAEIPEIPGMSLMLPYGLELDVDDQVTARYRPAGHEVDDLPVYEFCGVLGEPEPTPKEQG